MTRWSLTVFISYAHESDEHNAWVRKLADAIEPYPEFHVVFDQYELVGGMSLTHFMERGTRTDRVVVVVTPEYVRRAESRVGGVGYEASVYSADVLENQLTNRIVPVLRAGKQLPAFLRGRLYVDFVDNRRFATGIDELRAALLKTPRARRPGKLWNNDDSAPSVQPANVSVQYFTWPATAADVVVVTIEDITDVARKYVGGKGTPNEEIGSRWARGPKVEETALPTEIVAFTQSGNSYPTRGESWRFKRGSIGSGNDNRRYLVWMTAEQEFFMQPFDGPSVYEAIRQL